MFSAQGLLHTCNAMGGNISEGVLFVALCPLAGLGATAFVPSQTIFGAASSTWTDVGGRDQISRPRSRREPRAAIRMHTDTDTDTEPSSSSTVAPDASLTPMKFDARDARWA